MPQKKEIELIKTADRLGITLCNNDRGQVIIRQILPGSVAAREAHAIREGDIIEKINGEPMTGKGHREVAAKLQNIPHGTKFHLRLASLHSSGFSSNIPGIKESANSCESSSKQNTFNNNGNWEIQLMRQLNKLLADYYGYAQQDNALLHALRTLLNTSSTYVQFRAKINAKLGMLEIPNSLIEQIWNTIGPDSQFKQQSTM